MIYTQHANLDPNVWGQDPFGRSAADQLSSFDPRANIVGPERTLYDQYQNLLMDPSTMEQNPYFQFALQRAQDTTQRQLSAMRMRNSGRALEEMMATTTGTIGQQFRSLADIYGAGAERELTRWREPTLAGLEADKLRIDALTKSGEIGRGMSELELKRVMAGIKSPMEQYMEAAGPKWTMTPRTGMLGDQGGQWVKTPGFQGGYPNWVSQTWSGAPAPQMTIDQWRKSLR